MVQQTAEPLWPCSAPAPEELGPRVAPAPEALGPRVALAPEALGPHSEYVAKYLMLRRPPGHAPCTDSCVPRPFAGRTALAKCVDSWHHVRACHRALWVADDPDLQVGHPRGHDAVAAAVVEKRQATY